MQHKYTYTELPPFQVEVANEGLYGPTRNVKILVVTITGNDNPQTK